MAEHAVSMFTAFHIASGGANTLRKLKKQQIVLSNANSNFAAYLGNSEGEALQALPLMVAYISPILTKALKF